MPHQIPFRSFRSKLLFCLCALTVFAGGLSSHHAGLRPALSASRFATRCVNPTGANGCFTTISAAVAASVAGDTINVAAGTYNEQVNLNKAGLILRGNQTGFPACGRAGVSESIITHLNGPVQINADNVTVDGFTIQGATTQNNAGILANANFSGHFIRNNLIQNNVFGLYLNSTGPTTTTVQGNSFKNNNNQGPNRGTGIYSDTGLKVITINQNCFSGHSNASMALVGGPDKQSNINITNNNTTGEQFLELLFAKTVTIRGNRVENAPASAGAVNGQPGAAISIGGANTGVIIEGNTLNNNSAPAIHIRDPYNVGANAEVTVHCNRVVSNSAGGLLVQAGRYTGTLDAENNWWGCNAGPGGQGCGTVTNGVDFNPWLVTGLTAPSTAIKGAPSPISVNLNHNSAGAQAPCVISDPTPISLQTSCGVLSPLPAFIINGVANLTLTPNNLGTCSVTATVDNQSVTASLTVTDGPIVTVSAPPTCLGPGDKLTVRVQFANTSATPQTASFSTTLPAQLRAVVNSCLSTVGSCSNPNPSTVSYNATLAANQSSEVLFDLTISENVSTNEEFNLTINTNIGGKLNTVTNRIRVTCELVGPGRQLNPILSGGTQQPGSVLVFNVYTSFAATPNSQNTRLSLTNTSTNGLANVHLFFVSKDAQVTDAFVCLTPQQTASFLASDIDPGITGYVVAVAINAQTGCPTRFNHLIGDEFVKFSSGQQAHLGADAIPALNDLDPNCGVGLHTAEIRFDGVNYGRLPGIVAIDNAASRLDNNNTLWFINRFDGNLATETFAQATIIGMFYSDVEEAFEIGTYSLGCQLSGPLLPNRFTNGQRFETTVPSGRSGWVKLQLNTTGTSPGLLGAVINYNPNTRLTSSAYNQGHLLHKLTLSNTTVLIIPLALPNC